jgi:hypothetical protein
MKKKSKQPKPPSQAAHSHTCCVCRVTWECYDEEWMTRPLAKCGITVSAKSNHAGPYCNVCRTGIEFLRYCQHREIDSGAMLYVLRKLEQEQYVPAAALKL